MLEFLNQGEANLLGKRQNSQLSLEEISAEVKAGISESKRRLLQFKEQTEKLKELAKATVQSSSFETLLKEYSELKAAGQPINIIY